MANGYIQIRFDILCSSIKNIIKDSCTAGDKPAPYAFIDLT